MECGKVTYDTERAARKDRIYWVKGKKHELHPYRCTKCGKFHNTSNRRLQVFRK